MIKKLSIIITCIAILTATIVLSSNIFAGGVSTSVVKLNNAYFKAIQPARAETDPITHLIGGTILVKNLSADKKVQIHYTVDGQKWSDTDAQFDRLLSDGRELWTYQTPSYESRNFRFVVKMTANKTDYWDNNNNADYRIDASKLDYAQDYYFYFGDSNSASTVNRWNDYGSDELYGNVYLKNLAPEKEVKIRYTTDKWKTFNDVPAGYFKTYNNGQCEQWGFRVKSIPIDKPVEYAICYSVGGKVYWDNNFGMNYILEKSN